MQKIQTVITGAILLIITMAVGHAKQIKPDLSLLPPGTNISLIAQYTDGKKETLYSHQSQQMRIPASTQKIVTALAATLELGQNFRFSTEFKTNAALSGGKLNGNLVLQMSGDPTFTRQHLTRMVASLKEKGIHSINGNIIINTSVFSSHDKASGWSWNNLSQCYNTAPSAAIIDGNCFFASLAPAPKIGQTASVTVAAQYPVKIKSDVLTTAKNSDNRYCELDIVAKDDNKYRLEGCVRVTDAKRSFHFAVTDGPQYVGDILRTLLQQQKIAFKGKITESKARVAPANLRVLASHKSAPLPALLNEMLKRSNNLIADALFRTIGAHHFNMPGTWRNSRDAVKAILKNKAGIHLGNTVISDGSGLSRLNQINAKTMLSVLHYIANNDSRLNIIDKLPIAGVDGTLQYRNSLRNLPAKETIFAKTGYLEGSYNLAGFIKTKSNRYIAFVQFLTGYHPNDPSKPKKEAIMKFEEALYADCLKEFGAK